MNPRLPPLRFSEALPPVKATAAVELFAIQRSKTMVHVTVRNCVRRNGTTCSGDNPWLEHGQSFPVFALLPDWWPYT